MRVAEGHLCSCESFGDMNKVVRQNFHTTDKSPQTEPKLEVRWGGNPLMKSPTIAMSVITSSSMQAHYKEAYEKHTALKSTSNYIIRLSWRSFGEENPCIKHF